ncbi:DUF1648 domain-containing protein [Clostridium sp.]|uniref:DUF1648 domain-containing protein n=1 Tax=Clostridium sp. TaxID=1506 RepID=UPI0026398B9F|nr:DUF1648 domain-containing protein [Clostridium sp.]
MSISKRPNIKLPLSKMDKALIIAATVPITFIIIYLKMVWSNIPEIIPTHFGFSGVPDAYGNKTSLFIIIGICISLHIILALLSKVPKCYNYPVSITEENAKDLYKVGRQLILLIDLEVSFMLSILTWQNIQTAMGNRQGVSPIMSVAIIVITFATVIYAIIKMIKVQSK